MSLLQLIFVEREWSFLHFESSLSRIRNESWITQITWFSRWIWCKAAVLKLGQAPQSPDRLAQHSLLGPSPRGSDAMVSFLAISHMLGIAGTEKTPRVVHVGEVLTTCQTQSRKPFMERRKSGMDTAGLKIMYESLSRFQRPSAKRLET